MKTPVFCQTCAKLVDVDADPNDDTPCPDCGTLLQASEIYDVFISYATSDLTHAEQVAARLRSAGISHWLAPNRIGIGESFLTAINQALEGAKVIVLILSLSSVQSPWVRREITIAVSSNRPVLPLKIEEFDLPREWKILLSHNQWEDAFRQAFETHVDHVVTRVQAELRKAAARAAGASADLNGAAVALPVEAPPLEGVNPDFSPYVGPRPFPTLMADKFFGRQHEAEVLLRIIGQSRVVLVYAPSGAGKSSLLNTLICQSLEEEGLDVLLGARVGGALPDNVKAADIRNIYTYSAIYGLDSTTTPNPKCRLGDCLATIRRKPGTRGRILIFDQFEELFTQHVERFEDREGFFADVIAAMNEDPTLRVLFAMRQEYLADIDPLAAKLPDDLRMQRFALRRLDLAGALEAIVMPAARYATFAPGVAEEIVRQLNTVKVPGFDGVIVEKRGEFIEIVHLQIVCERLWSSLPRGITCIEMEHVKRAAGEGKAFNEFVVSALDEFYDATIEKVVNSRTTLEHGGYSKGLIRLGCMKFVTTASTRTMVQHVNGRTGRLPDWIVEQLENSHLLRAEQRGGQRWYELAHDLLAEPVGRQMDRNVSSLLHAADLLNKTMEKALEENGDRLQGYFVEHRDILIECQPFHGQAGLFPDEAEFVFRASLASGRQMCEWSRRLGGDFPQVRLDVLRDAVGTASEVVRRHAAVLLGLEPVDELLAALVQLALSDPDAAVRHAAAMSLAQLDRPELYARLVAALDDPATRNDVRDAWSRIRIVADRHVNAPAFETSFRQLNRSRRGRIRRHAWVLRFWESLPVVPFVVLPAALFAAISAAAFKWLPGWFNLALSQDIGSAASGAFHGATAGVIWAGLIILGLTIYYLVFGRELGARSYLRPFGAIVTGTVCGVISSAMITLVVAGVFNPTALVTMGWLTDETIPRTSPAFWQDLFIETRFAWLYFITGTGLGIGMALMTNGLRASGRWSNFLEKQSHLTGLHQTKHLLREIMKIAARHIWPLVMVLTLAGYLAFRVPYIGPDATKFRRGNLDLTLSIASDCATQAIGAYFAIIGMGLGIVIVRFGVHLEPRRN